MDLDLVDALWLWPALRPLLANHNPFGGYGTGGLYCTSSTRFYHRFFNWVEGCHQGHRYGPWRRGGKYVWWGP